MELDELKNTWQQYDQKLEENLKLNEQLFRSLKLDHSQKAMFRPLLTDIFNVLILFIMLLIATTHLRELFPDLILRISILGFLLYCIICITLSIKRIIALTNIDYYNSTVVELQKKISDFKKMYQKFKIIEMVCIPLLFGLPFLVLKIQYQEDIHSIPLIVLAIGLILGLGLGCLLYQWLYKHLYDKQIKATNHFLKELEEFEKE